MDNELKSLHAMATDALVLGRKISTDENIQKPLRHLIAKIFKRMNELTPVKAKPITKMEM